LRSIDINSVKVAYPWLIRKRGDHRPDSCHRASSDAISRGAPDRFVPASAPKRPAAPSKSI
jgi:hypothetical protein